MSGQVRMHWRAIALIVIIFVAVTGIVGFFLAESKVSVCFGGICGGGRVYINSVNCSSSHSRCELVLVNTFSVNLNTTKDGGIAFNNQNSLLSCTVVSLKPNITGNVSCTLQTAAPTMGTHYTGFLITINGESVLFSGNFTA